MALGDRGTAAFERLHGYWKDESKPVMKRLVEAVTAELELDDTLDDIQKAHTIDHATGRSLELVAYNLGVVRMDGESDDRLRDRIKFWAFVQTSWGSVDQIKRAVAWWVGIVRGNDNWETDYLPQIKLFRRDEPHYIESKEPAFYYLEMPWTILDYDYGDVFGLAATPASNDPADHGYWWVTNTSNGLDAGIWDGNHLLIDILDLLGIMTQAGGRYEIHGTSDFGFSNSPTSQDPADHGYWWVSNNTAGFDADEAYWPGLAIKHCAVEPATLDALNRPFRGVVESIRPHAPAYVIHHSIRGKTRY